jgi:hypothetical protein
MIGGGLFREKKTGYNSFKSWKMKKEVSFF